MRADLCAILTIALVTEQFQHSAAEDEIEADISHRAADRLQPQDGPSNFRLVPEDGRVPGRPFVRPPDFDDDFRPTGRWSSWSAWRDCSCELKTQFRVRFCRNRSGVPRLVEQESVFGLNKDLRLPREAAMPKEVNLPQRLPERPFPVRCLGPHRQSRPCTPTGCPGDTPPEGGLDLSLTKGVYVYKLDDAIKVHLSAKSRKYLACVASKKVDEKQRGTQLARKKRLSCRSSVLGVVARKGLINSTSSTAEHASRNSNWTIGGRAGASSCSNLPQFFNKVRSGMDAAYLDYYSTSSSNGIENTLLTISCDFGAKIEIQGVMYDLPDQATTFYSVSVQELFTDTGRIQTSSEVKQTKHDEFSLSASYKSFFSFSGSYSYKQMQTQLRQTDDYYYKFKYQAASFVFPLDFDTPIDEAGSGAAYNFITSRLLGKTYASRARDFQDFVQIYGTHALYRAKLGGVVEISVAVRREFSSKHSTSETHRQAQLSVLSFLKAKGATTTTTEQTSQQFKSSSTLTARCFGGNAAGACGSLSIPQWASSVPTHPHLLSGEALPISSFIADQTLRDNLDIAICRHMAIVYLNDLDERITAVLNFNALQPAVRSMFLNLRQDGRQMKSKLADNSQASQHRDLCFNRVQDDLAIEAERVLAYMHEGVEQTVALSRVNYDQSMSQTCPNDYVLSRMKAVYSDRHKDRQWDDQCRSSTFNLFSVCQWTVNYVNQYKQAFTYLCPARGAIAGLRSVHDGGSNEDRIWKFRCCQLDPDVLARCSVSCSWVGGHTQAKAPFDLQPPAGKYINGFNTRVWHYVRRRLFSRRRYYTDRMWRLHICQVNFCA